ncbi:MAG: CatB-related O-acetyltransferase [Methylococcales bacterium]|nr:CatB-related O-acetyltransferase [Methylococcaceae bacterium]
MAIYQKLKPLLKNPVTLWLKYLGYKYYLEWNHADKNLSIGYMSNVHQCRFGHFNTLFEHVSMEYVDIGDFSYVASNTRISHATIGKFCCIAQDIIIGPGKHPTADFVSSHPIFYSPLNQSQMSFATNSVFEEFSQTEIGNDVWIGARAIIMDGVKIGDGAIIGAGAIVTKDIPAYAVACGMPAKVLRYRFEPAEIDFLKQFEWWNKDIAWLEKHADKFRNIKALTTSDLHSVS